MWARIAGSAAASAASISSLFSSGRSGSPIDQPRSTRTRVAASIAASWISPIAVPLGGCGQGCIDGSHVFIGVFDWSPGVEGKERRVDAGLERVPFGLSHPQGHLSALSARPPCLSVRWVVLACGWGGRADNVSGEESPLCSLEVNTISGAILRLPAHNAPHIHLVAGL